MNDPQLDELQYVDVNMAYTDHDYGQARVRIFPPASGRKMESPNRQRVNVKVYDCRPLLPELDLDTSGFAVIHAETAFSNFYDEAAVRSEYFSESAELLRAHLGARAVYVFDYNVRNKTLAEQHVPGVGYPTDGAHNDYTLESGPRRIEEVLAENNATESLKQRAAIINIWRPIRGPVQDHPLAVCDARSTRLADFIATDIEHYSEDNLDKPSLRGQIYSFLHSKNHRWFYVADMQKDEVMFLKCYDTVTDGRACFTGHTGFYNPACPEDYLPRESIELRTVVVYDEPRTEPAS